MSRAHVSALALVNWKGVFYERYRLDRHVTALEGANGAGKTTVMIAAYVVLLPDMSRLRFTNVGESGASGGDRGIWGRLGEPGRPSYAALDIQLADSARLVVGVRLRRGSEPSVEPTAFMIDGLAPEVQLSELFLIRTAERDAVAELDEIKATTRGLGARLEVFRSTKEYFAALFERGILPLRLSAEEERNKWNEMLRTSMTGGISRVLTSELRSFLLKEESGLGDVLGRMRGNLDACRRTRSEVAEARVLERDISGVYEAGQAMFGCALHAARLAAQEAEHALGAARAAHDAATGVAEQLKLQLTEAATRERALEHDSERVRREQLEGSARLERLRAAQALSDKLATLAQELAEVEQRKLAARAVQVAAAAERAARRVERERMQEAQRAAALGLAQLQNGLDELHRRAHAYRELGARLSEARELLELPELTLDDVPAQLTRVLAERGPAQAERARCQREHDGAEARAAERARAVQALQTLEAALSPVAAADSGNELARARRVLAQLAELDTELARLPQLEQELAEAARLAARQAELRADAARLGVGCGTSAASALERQVQALEQQLRTALEQAALADAAVRGSSEARVLLRERQSALEQRSLRYEALDAAARRVQALLGAALGSDVELSAAREQLAEALMQLKTQRSERLAEREHDLRLAADLAGPGAALDAELLQLRDRVGAELLLERYDDVPESEAKLREAQLGPLLHALVVEDPEAAALQLLDQPRSAPTLWLLRAGADPAPRVVRAGEYDVVTEDAGAVRLARMPEQPTLGAGARRAHAEQLRARAEHAAAALEQLEARSRELLSARRDLDQLAAQLPVWLAGDPASELAEARASLPRIEATEQAARADLATVRARAAELRARLDGLTALLPDRALLEPPEYAPHQAELTERVRRVRFQREQLGPFGPARALLAELLDVLRDVDAPRSSQQPAYDATVRVDLSVHIAALDTALERGYRSASALEAALAQRHAQSWHDAPQLLLAQTELVPSLEVQHEQAHGAVQAADAAVLEADATWEHATALAQQADAVHAGVVAEHERLALELRALGGSPEPAQLTAAEREAVAAHERASVFERDARALVSELARLRERAEQAQHKAAETAAAAELARQRAEPKHAAWQAQREAAQDAGLLADLAAVGGEPVNSSELLAQAESHAALLAERLTKSRGGEEAAAQITARSGPNAMLEAWQLAREWLRRRVPLQVAQHDDPLLALERLRDHLDVLQGRLARQEADLRGASEDVARGIDVQLRRALGQVRRLNAQVAGVQFGSIAALRVEMRRVDRMEQILRALREGDAQELLFLPSIPIEEALDEIFRRYGGGKGGGARLLDYREYVELVVEIRRKTGEQWEPASPTRLSTGEAIGVGAALMMVVLTEWERDANLLRAQRQFGSLRFLFLDEANRLSRDNLGVLFELCRNLDLQLLIAAPEVARAEGNTTYRLVRQVRDDGQEEVIVSGRRALASLAEPTFDGTEDAGHTEPESEPEAHEVQEPLSDPTQV